MHVRMRSHAQVQNRAIQYIYVPRCWTIKEGKGHKEKVAQQQDGVTLPATNGYNTHMHSSAHMSAPDKCTHALTVHPRLPGSSTLGYPNQRCDSVRPILEPMHHHTHTPVTLRPVLRPMHDTFKLCR